MARPKSIENRSELILQAADELFSRYGFERTSIEDIARHLGISKGAIYLDFKSKEDILFTIIERHAQRLHKLMDEKIAAAASPAIDILRDTVLESSLLVYDLITRDLHTPEALLHTSIAWKPRFEHYFVKKRARFLTLLQRAADEGDIAPHMANEATVLAFMMAISSIHPPYFDNYSEARDRMSRDLLEQRGKVLVGLLIDGLRCR